LEQTAGLWAASYMVMERGVSETIAAGWASLFYLGITAGRFASGFVTMKYSDRSMVRIGQGLIVVGALLLILPLGTGIMCAGLVIVGVGCAPIYPSLLHETPENFGASRSQAIMGLQMACAYMGTTLVPPVFGMLAEYVSIALYPAVLLIIAAVMIAGSEKLNVIHRMK
jgi:fucose permease